MCAQVASEIVGGHDSTLSSFRGTFNSSSFPANHVFIKRLKRLKERGKTPDRCFEELSRLNHENVCSVVQVFDDADFRSVKFIVSFCPSAEIHVFHFAFQIFHVGMV
jgi:hypothetical protein